MDETIISVNLPNTISIGIMVFLFFILVYLVVMMMGMAKGNNQ